MEKYSSAHWLLYEISKRKANWIGHILRRNCLLKQVIEGKIKGDMEVAIRRGRRRMKLLDDLKDRRGYWHLKEEALDRTMWRHRFGGGFGPVVRQNTEWMKEWWREELSETCRISNQNKFVKLVHNFDFIIQKFVTMYGHVLRCTVTCYDAQSRVTMHGHMSRCTITGT